jgi:hypothetical protein
MPDKHILSPQRKPRKDGITDPYIRANMGLSPLNPRVKSTSSPMSTMSPISKKSSKISPALQSSENKLKPPKTSTKISNTQSFNPSSKEKLSFSQLPYDLINKMFKKAFLQDEYVLREWIEPYEQNLNLKELAKNSNSTSYFYKKFKENPDNKDIDWYLLSGNPNAIELIKEKLEYEKKQSRNVLEFNEKVNWQKLSANPNAIELLEQKIKEENNQKHTNPANFKELNYSEIIDWDILCKNPNAIKLLKENFKEITHSIFLNKNMDTELITILLDDNEKNGSGKIWTIPKITRVILNRFPNKIDYKQLSKNTSYKAIQLLTAKAEKEKKLIEETPGEYKKIEYSTKIIHWNIVSENPKAIELLTAKAMEEKALRDKNFEEYNALYDNYKIHWDKLSSNPKAIELLTAKAREEKKLRDEDFEKYNALYNNYRICWDTLSALGTNAIELLKTKAKEEKKLRDEDFEKYIDLYYKYRINWDTLSALGTNAIELLTSKAIEEQYLRENNINQYESLSTNSKINWNKLSANPKAIKLLEKYPQYIDFEGLCANPNAVKLIRKNIDKLKPNHWKILSFNPCIFKEKR